MAPGRIVGAEAAALRAVTCHAEAARCLTLDVLTDTDYDARRWVARLRRAQQHLAEAATLLALVRAAREGMPA